MTTSNDYIADQFSLLSKLMDIHGENAFKAKSYSIAAFTIEKLPTPLADLPREKIFSIKGIGDAIGKKIIELLETGGLPLIQEIVQKTPPGVIEMLGIKGLGPKKIAVIWKEMGVESIGELLYACQENRLLLYKGFGEKTQKSIAATIEFYLANQGNHLYAALETYTKALEEQLKAAFPKNHFFVTAAFRRQLEIIEQLEFVTDAERLSLQQYFEDRQYTIITSEEHKLNCRGSENVLLGFHLCPASYLAYTLFRTSASSEFLEAWAALPPLGGQAQAASEEEIFEQAKIPWIPPFLREGPAILTRIKENPIDKLIQPSDIKAIVHSHSNWSDGSNSIEEMALACRQQGFEWMAISDHSKSAFYANGLSEARIQEQHLLVDELNRKMTPFRIFKSIESDILGDGSLDYSDDILSTFDLVIASIHSNLKMTEEKAMSRLLRAIENPFTTIMGHLTGRLLLSRPGYPIDHVKIIDACASHQVVLELNAHPRRLDLDWRWIEYALGKGVLLSIDPDAHSISGYGDIRYGALVAQKGGLTADKNLSSFSLLQMEKFLEGRKNRKN